MLHLADPPVHEYAAAPGQVILRLVIPTAGQSTLARVRDERVGLLMLIFYVLANPRLGLKTVANTRLDDEQFFWKGGVAMPRVEVIRVLRPDAVAFFFFPLDPNFDLDLGISRAIAEKREPSGEEWRRRIDVISSQAYYVDNTLAHAKLPVGESVLLDLNNPQNKAQLKRVLGEGGLAFQHSAQVLPVLYQHPQIQLFLSLSTDQAWREGLTQDQAEELCKRQAWAARGSAIEAEEEDALDQAKRSGDFDSLLLPWASVSPALKAVLQWGAQHPPGEAVALETFRQKAQRFLDALENDFQVASLHKEIFLGFVASLGVYEYEYGLKHHILYSGNSARGKSFILSLLHRFWIPGSFERVSYETKRANATETNMNAMIVTYDEVSAELFKPGVGDPELKERLSAGRTTSRVFAQKDGRRKTQRIESRQQILVIGDTNESLDKLPDAIYSRFHCCEIEPTATRPGKDLVHLLAVERDEARQNAFIQELRQAQAKAARVYTKIFCGLLPPVDMSEALAALAQVQDYVKRFGYDILPRDMLRLVLLARSLAIWASEEDQPVRCTREMALFCLREQSIYCPKLKRVVQELKYNVDQYNSYDAVVTKNPDPMIFELQARSMVDAGVVRSVVGHLPFRILRAFRAQNASDVLTRAVQAAKSPGAIVVGWGGEPHQWKVLE